MEKMSFRFFDNARTGQLLSRITSDIVEISELTFRGPNDLLVCSISMIGTIIMMLYMNPYLGGLISLMLVGKTVHTVFINRKMKKAFRRSREKAGEVSAQAVSILAAVLFFISIFLFKNPKKQKSAVYASMVITLASIITGAIILYSGEVCGTPTVACSCPVIAFIAAMLAVKGIKRDEKIIRDSERIR